MNVVRFCCQQPSKFSLPPDITLQQWMKLQIGLALVNLFYINTFHQS
jgi:hypothetical protein